MCLLVRKTSFEKQMYKNIGQKQSKMVTKILHNFSKSDQIAKLLALLNSSEKNLILDLHSETFFPLRNKPLLKWYRHLLFRASLSICFEGKISKQALTRYQLLLQVPGKRELRDHQNSLDQSFRSLLLCENPLASEEIYKIELIESSFRRWFKTFDENFHF